MPTRVISVRGRDCATLLAALLVLAPPLGCGCHVRVEIDSRETAPDGNDARRQEDRKARGLSLRQEAMRLGITAEELSRIENGRNDDAR